MKQIAFTTDDILFEGLDEHTPISLIVLGSVRLVLEIDPAAYIKEEDDALGIA